MKVIDLHGCHIHEGWRVFNRRIEEAYLDNYRRVTVITGQGSMMNEILTWAHNHPRIREARQSNNFNPGSFIIFLKKRS